MAGLEAVRFAIDLFTIFARKTPLFGLLRQVAASVIGLFLSH
jgi:hypothetical protein